MSKIKEGDFIRVKGGRNIVQVGKACDGRYSVHGKQDFCTVYTDNDGLERLEPKVAFRTELAELMEKYDIGTYYLNFIMEGESTSLMRGGFDNSALNYEKI